MERLKRMKERLIDCVEEQINTCLQSSSAEELGEAVDMIKDLDEAIYYGTLTKAMEENSQQQNYYCELPQIMPLQYPYERYELPYGGRGETMYYGGGNNNNGGGNINYYQQGYNRNMPMSLPYQTSSNEGRSEIRRRMYMEGKHSHPDKTQQMKDLEAYVQDLGQDITDMIQDASPEEKQLLQQKISMLASKIK